MLVDARRPGFKKKWVRIPSLDVKFQSGEHRLENRPEVHRAVDVWIRAARPDIPKAAIALRRTNASGRHYAAFVSPSCDSTMGQFHISCILPDKWSILSGPAIETPAPAPVAHSGGSPDM